LVVMLRRGWFSSRPASCSNSNRSVFDQRALFGAPLFLRVTSHLPNADQLVGVLLKLNGANDVSSYTDVLACKGGAGTNRNSGFSVHLAF
jgi:hypothetical protein